jgi:hypothetical protein
MKAKAWVTGAAQGSIGFNLSMIVVDWYDVAAVYSQWTGIALG